MYSHGAGPVEDGEKTPVVEKLRVFCYLMRTQLSGRSVDNMSKASQKIYA